MAFQTEGQETPDFPDDDDWEERFTVVAPWLWPPYDKPETVVWPALDSQSGINFEGAEIEIRHITDGASNTYMVGEKNLDPDCYEGTDTVPSKEGNFGCGGDGHSYFQGFDWDTHRFGAEPPIPDSPGAEVYTVFGAAHPVVWHVALCDGSVRGILYDIDAVTHKRLSNRHDGQALGAF
jgi:hypothetical protein